MVDEQLSFKVKVTTTIEFIKLTGTNLSTAAVTKKLKYLVCGENYEYVQPKRGKILQDIFSSEHHIICLGFCDRIINENNLVNTVNWFYQQSIVMQMHIKFTHLFLVGTESGGSNCGAQIYINIQYYFTSHFKVEKMSQQVKVFQSVFRI